MSSEVSEARRNVRAPRIYSAGQSFKTWLSQFVQYADLVRIKPWGRRVYLLTILDQPAFKAVELLKLSEFLPFDEFTGTDEGGLQIAATSEVSETERRFRGIRR